MMDLYLIFGFVKGSFHGTRLCWVKRESNEGELTPRAFSARSPGVSTVMFRYYLLEGDTAAPSGLYARLCHAFLVYHVRGSLGL